MTNILENPAGATEKQLEIFRRHFRAPVEVAAKHELAKMAEKGAPPDLGTLFVLYAKVGDETAQAWARGERPNHIFIEKTGRRFDLNEC